MIAFGCGPRLHLYMPQLPVEIGFSVIGGIASNSDIVCDSKRSGGLGHPRGGALVLHDGGRAGPGGYPILDMNLKAVLANFGFCEFRSDGGFDFGIAELASAVGFGEVACRQTEGSGEQAEGEQAGNDTNSLHARSVGAPGKKSQEKTKSPGTAPGLGWELAEVIKPLLNFFAALFPMALPGQRLFGALLLARLQIKRVAFDFFDNVLLLNLALETAQGAFKTFSILNVDFRQLRTHPLTHASP